MHRRRGRRHGCQGCRTGRTASRSKGLDPANDDTGTLGQLLVSAPASLLTAHPVSTLVNNVRNQGPELIVEATKEQLVG